MSKNPSFVNQLLSAGRQELRGSRGTPIVGKVIHVVYGPFLSDGTVDQYYQNPTDEGKIIFQLVYGSQNRSKQGAGNPTAQPINSSFKNYPVPNEYVLITPGPSEKLNKDREAQSYYYFPPLRVWGASHHNALVDAGDYSEYINNANKNYRANQPTNLSSGQSITYPLDPDFPEKEYLKTLRSFIGDVIVEGRWGNSIRFGSTSVNKTNNSWSDEGEPGSPITIIRNGQGRQLDETAWIPTVENINRDDSLIYLTSGQKIVIDDIQNNFPLTSWGISLETTNTASIPLQQQLTSFDNISPLDQDKFVSNNE